MKIKAHVPTQQYGFIEISGEPSEAKEIERLYNHYAEQPVAFKKGNRKKLKAFAGGEVYYDADAHVYTNEAGEVYLSGSVYASQGEPKFDVGSISGAMAKKFDVDPKDIADMWKLKGDISAGFGTAIHAAIQLYEQYDGLAKTLGKTSNHHDHPVLQQAVQKFVDSHKGQKVISEAMVVSHKRKWAGQIDRLIITGEKRCIVGDIKTNADLTEKKLKTYWKQLQFYGTILEDDGWTVEGLEINHFNGEWRDLSGKMVSL
jgi:hypothetical protein